MSPSVPIAVLLLVGGAGIARSQVPEAIRFADVTTDAGLGSIKAHGVATGDFDGDEALDLLLAGQERIWLFRNVGKGKFVDVTEKAGLAKVRNTHTGGGAYFVDFDDDGDLDVFVAPRFMLQNTKGRFEDVSEKLGFKPNDDRAESAAFGDFNGDGRPDIVVGRIGVEGGDPFAGGPLRLYVRDRAGKYRESANEVLQGMENRCTRIPAWCDYDGDGDLDLYVGSYRCFADYLFENRNGKLVNVAKEAGFPQTPGQADENEHTIGAVWLDYDGDGDFDLFHHAQHTPPRLHRNDGGGKFTEVGKAAGVAGETTEHLGVTVGDFDDDGWPDLFYTVEREGESGSVLLRNDGDATFSNVTAESGLGKVWGFGTACADFDGDGDLDLLVTSEEHSADGKGLQEIHLFRNESARTGAWADVRLSQKPGNLLGVGARVEVEAGGRKIVQQVVCGDGSLSQRPMTLHFGLGSATKIDRVTVTWPGNKKEVFKDVKTGRLNTLKRGAGVPG